MNHFTRMSLGKNPPVLQVKDAVFPGSTRWLGPDTVGLEGLAVGEARVHQPGSAPPALGPSPWAGS